MSVAFRRESDEEHKEPRFDIPLPPGPNLVTARGHAAIVAKVAELDTALAAASDDDTRTALRRELKYWTTRANTAQLAPEPTGDAVAFGTRVTYRLDGRETSVDLVGSDEADPAAGRIAFTAPVARAMIGAGAGDFVPLGDRDDAIAIVSVVAIPQPDDA